MEIKIGNYTIGAEHKPFIIAEMSGNHNQSLDRALQLVDAAAEAGAHALKIQTYTADTITLNARTEDFTINDKNSLWYGKNLYDLYTEAYTPWDWHKAIFDRAKEKGMLAFSSPFDETAVDFLEELNVPCYKIASFENTHFPLIKKVIQTGKPFIISTGVATLSDLQDLQEFLLKNNAKNYILLKCTSTYPASPENTNILTIPHMSQLFNCHVGLSDHTMGIGVSIAAIALGARVIEKHFTLNRNDGGVDSAFSLEPAELKSLVYESERAFLSLGKVNYTLGEKELKSREHKRSIYVSADIRKGEKITINNVKVVRPAFGLSPKYWEEVLGKTINTDVMAGTPLSIEMLD